MQQMNYKPLMLIEPKQVEQVKSGRELRRQKRKENRKRNKF
jgi:hypothetical protein